MRKLYAESVVAVADTQIGYTEKDTPNNLDDWSNGGSGNYTKYARDMDQRNFFNFHGEKPKQGHDYCTVFNVWSIQKAGDCDNDRLRYVLCVPEGEENLSAGAVQQLDYFKKAGRFFLEPKIGDYIFISWSGSDEPDHVGFVSDVGKDLKAYTIEANRNNTVGYYAYPHGYYRVIGFGRPRYDEPGSSENEEKLRKENDKLKKQNAIYEEKLRNIAEIAA